MLYQKGEDTKALILNGSKKIFISRGYKETTYKIKMPIPKNSDIKM